MCAKTFMRQDDFLGYNFSALMSKGRAGLCPGDLVLPLLTQLRQERCLVFKVYGLKRVGDRNGRARAP